MSRESTYILKVTESGLQILRPGEPAEPEEKSTPVREAMREPRWPHWSQRKLARLWQATLLAMNIEPTVKARAALKEFEPEKYQIYRDRLDIAKTLIGYELEFYEDHVLEGDLPGEKYVLLTDYYDFALKKGWKGLEPLRDGMSIETNPPVLHPRTENNVLKLLHAIFTSVVPDYGNVNNTKSAAAVWEWLQQQNVDCPVDRQQWGRWIERMKDTAHEQAEKDRKKAMRDDL